MFLLNGHAGEAVDPMVVKAGDRVQIRLINTGNVAHPIHIHGHTFRMEWECTFDTPGEDIDHCILRGDGKGGGRPRN